MKCKGCCQFLKEELYFAPLITQDEKRNIESKHDTAGAEIVPHNSTGTVFQIKPIPSKKNPGEFVCPFYDEETTFCRIYADRPLDCRLWPIMVARDETGKLLITISKDEFCPALQETDAQTKKKYGEYVVKALNEGPYGHIFAKYPDLAWKLEADMVPLGTMEINSVPTVQPQSP